MAALGPSNFGGERLSSGPDCPIFKILFFPDGDRAFKGINEPAAGIKGSRSMLRGHYDQHAEFSPI